MKKLLFLLILFLGFFSNAQINTQVTPLNVCDNNTDGIAAFDLTSKIPEILNNLDPATYTVTFHETMVNAQSGVSAIGNPATYINMAANSQTIYVRVVSTANVVSLTSFSLIVNSLPAANQASQFFCDTMELAIYNLSESNATISGGAAGVTITYHVTELDAINNTNAIPNDIFIPTVVPVQIVFARVQNPVTGCFSITTVTLNTHNCTPPVCNPPIDVTASSLTSTTAVISWTAAGSGALAQILVLPFGSPAPTAATSGWAYSQSNPFVITALNIDTCYSVYVRIFCPNTNATVSAWSEPVEFCMYDCTNNAQCPESIGLIAFLDTNNNGTKDNGEPDFTEGNFVYDINDSGTPVYATSNNGNFYIFENNPANSYDLSYAINPALSAYFSVSATYSNITVPTGSGSTAYYFPITQLQPYNDLEVYIIPMGAPRPGFVYHNLIHYRNKGFQTVSSGTVSFTNSATVTVTAVSQSGITTLPNGFSYDFTNLAPNETRTIQVSMLVPTIPTVNLGDFITNSATVNPTAGDASPANNAASITQTVIGSYDPNDKMEEHGPRIFFDDFTANDYLTYTIRFENTGTAAAEFIRIEDTLAAGLNASSLVVLDASHPVDVRRIGNQLIWNFYNINLPPTLTNPTQSHGYVRFKVKPTAGYNVGTTILNRAEIYFDYNPPIITNVFETEFVDVLGLSDFSFVDFTLVPNPAQTVFSIGLNASGEGIKNIGIYSILGNLIKAIPADGLTEMNVDVSGISKGIYLVEVITENNLRMTKKLVIR